MPLKERWDKIFDSIHKSIPADEIYNSVEMDHRKETDAKGHNTERTFVRHMWAFFAWKITAVDRANYEDDRRGIDYFVTFKDGSRIPVQVKSSDEAVADFKREENYLNLGKRVIVINSSRKVSKSKFKSQIDAELRRIQKLTNSS